MNRFSLYTLATAFAAVNAVNIIDVNDLGIDFQLFVGDKPAFEAAATTKGLDLCNEDFQDTNYAFGLSWESNSEGSCPNCIFGVTETGVFYPPLVIPAQGLDPERTYHSTVFADGQGTFIDQFDSDDTGFTIFHLPAGTNAWGADFDFPFISPGSGLRLFVDAYTPANDLVKLGEIDGTFTGFWGFILPSGYEIDRIKFYRGLDGDIVETYLLDNMTYEKSATGQTCGDPHFTRWQHEIRDQFHGECDLVLMHKENVEQGVDLDVHVRTTIRDSYSYIESSAVKIGKNVVEFETDAVYLNGIKKEDEEFPLDLGNNNKVIMDHGKRRTFNVRVMNRINVEVSSTKHYMSVKINGHEDVLIGSVGMLGDYQTGDMVSRDGKILDSYQEFGFEWQVQPEDAQLFRIAREPQLPYELCRMPTISAESRRRKLRGTQKELYQQAFEACMKNHIPGNVQSCVDDVMFTGELDLAEVF